MWATVWQRVIPWVKSTHYAWGLTAASISEAASYSTAEQLHKSWLPEPRGRPHNDQGRPAAPRRSSGRVNRVIYLYIFLCWSSAVQISQVCRMNDGSFRRSMASPPCPPPHPHATSTHSELEFLNGDGTAPRWAFVGWRGALRQNSWKGERRRLELKGAFILEFWKSENSIFLFK